MRATKEIRQARKQIHQAIRTQLAVLNKLTEKPDFIPKHVARASEALVALVSCDEHLLSCD